MVESPENLKSNAEPSASQPAQPDNFLKLVDLITDVSHHLTPEESQRNTLFNAGEMLSGVSSAIGECMRIAGKLTAEQRQPFLLGFSDGIARQITGVTENNPTPERAGDLIEAQKLTSGFLTQALSLKAAEGITIRPR